MNEATITTAPLIRRVRAYFAPVNRATNQPTLFDPSQLASFNPDAPPAPWHDLGWIHSFERHTATTIDPLRTGAPAVTTQQSRTLLEATLSFAFESWGKLQVALACGTQQMNLLKPVPSALAEGSGGTAIPAIALTSGASTATTLHMDPTDAATFTAGELVAIDTDYTGATGYLGAAVSGAFVKTALTDVDYIRRITFNIARILSIQEGVITLTAPLLAGIPTDDMKVSAVVGLCDREGSSFFQEWSALFLAEGQQGERILWHYPRLQPTQGIAESITTTNMLDKLRLAASFRALPVRDPVDNETVLCFRSYIPG